MRKLCAVSILVLFFSCGKKKIVPSGILEPEKMQAVFWDYIRADAYAWNFIKKDASKNDTTRNIQLQKKIFNYYNITREEFYTSYRYYADHPELMSVLVDSITAKQSRQHVPFQKAVKSATKSIYE